SLIIFVNQHISKNVLVYMLCTHFNRNEPHPDRHASRTTQERGGTSSSRNGSSGSKSAALSSKSQSSSSQNRNNTEATTKCKVVCVKFEVDDVDEAYLKKLLGQFGAIVKIIMLPRMAFVNMGTAGQAEDIVKYFYQNPLRIRGELIVFTLSAAFNFLQTSRVVSFSPLPSSDGIRSELTAIAKRFGSVKHSLFLPSRGYVEMSSAEEADKLVEHYSTNSLKIKGKTINVCSSTEYQTLEMTDADKEKSPVPYSSSSSSSRRRRRRSCSPRRRSHRDSPSPKRRASEERSRSRRSHDSKKREESRRSREKTKESSRRDSSSKSRSKKSSPSKDQKQKTKTEESVKETVEDDNNQSDIMTDDSDLEGVAVIADDGEALNSEDELTVDEEMDDEAHETSDEQDASEDVQTVKESDDQTKPSDMDTSSIQPETSECAPTATTSERSSDCKEAQELQQGEQNELQQGEKKELQEKLKEIQQGEQKEPQEKPKELQEKKKELQEEQKELQQGEKKELQQKELKQEEQKELKQGEKKELQQGELQQGEQNQQQGEQKDNTVEMEEAADFSENLDKEGVLTEKGIYFTRLLNNSTEKFGKVLEVAGFPVAKKYSEADLLKIGKKYGDVANCCLVRSNRKVEKALIEMVNAADAAKLEAECKRQHIKLGGRNLRITVSKKYSHLNEGQSVDADTEKQKVKEDTEENNKEPSSTLASSEESTVVMAETEISEEDAEAQEEKETSMDTIMQTSSDEEDGYGRVLRIRNLPMPDEYTDAEFLSIAEPYGKVVRHWMFRLHRTGLIEMKNASDAEKVVAAANMNKITVAGMHPKISVSTKHAHLNKRYWISSNDNRDDNSKGDEKQVSAADDGSYSSASAQLIFCTLPTGTEFVRPVVGYFCSLCNAIYASEEEAKDEHCRTPVHHQKLKANLHRLLICMIYQI
uniref:Uncharacterized LOC107741065 n=1 Tax=Sinocyclocheilus rhinocerous TaxID=307959 RepID=A0A673MZ43_9TELE